MKIRPVGTELFHTDGRADRQTDRQAGRHDEDNVAWIKLDQLDVTCFIISLFTAQHV